MVLSPFGDNLCSCRNMDIRDLCYLMLMNMSLQESEYENIIFSVYGMGGICHMVSMFASTIAPSIGDSHLFVDSPSITNTLTYIKR